MSTGPEPKRSIEAGNEVVCLPSCKVGTNKTKSKEAVNPFASI